MAAWVVVPCLLVLRDEFNAVNPQRDKGSDGTIGDTSHSSTSDHTPDEDSSALAGKDADHTNEVHALDIDATGPWPGGWSWFDATIKGIATRERADYEHPTIKGRLQYIIWNAKIISRSWGWAEWRPYTGSSDMHTGHAHFSARYDTTAESRTDGWGVAPEDWIDMATQAELEEANRDALMAPLPYHLQRLADRGWNNLSVNGKLDYLFEAVVGPAPTDADHDGVAAENASLQSRLTRCEDMLRAVLDILTPPPAPPAP